jgi:hypothetical protein
MDRLPVPEQHIALAKRRHAAHEALLFDDSFDEVLVAGVIEGDVEVPAILGHVEEMRLRINEETPGTGLDILDGKPCPRHRADMLGIEVIRILMRPGRRVALEIHALHELAGFIEQNSQHGLERGRRDNIGAEFPEVRKKSRSRLCTLRIEFSI